jgi:hypothetical protein
VREAPEVDMCASSLAWSGCWSRPPGEDAGNRGDGKGSSGLNMNMQEGGQEEEAKAESSVLVSDPLLLEGHVMKLVLRSALFHRECMLESTLCG